MLSLHSVMQSRGTSSSFQLVEIRYEPADYQSEKFRDALPAGVVRAAQASWLTEQLRRMLLSSAQFLKGLLEQAWLPTTWLQELVVTYSQGQPRLHMRSIQ